MSKLAALTITVALTAQQLVAQAAGPLSITSDGWTLVANREQKSIQINFEKLGTVLTNVRLHLQSERGMRPLDYWTVEKRSENELSIRTVQPRSAWLFELRNGILKISSTSTAAVLTAQAPASADRVVARLLDPQGIPVQWKGNDEMVSAFGGAKLRTPSYLPSRNADCMHFALGQVSGSTFHSLFDRNTDIAIDFSNQAHMQRNSRTQDLLDITIPVPGNTLIRVFPDYFTKTLGVPRYVKFDDSYFKTAPMVWSSWTSYYHEIYEKDIVANAKWIARNLKPYGFEYVQLDEGYELGKDRNHYWTTNWDSKKFPHGPQWLANSIRSLGLHAGLWIVPNTQQGMAEQHPDWFLRDKQGNFILDYKTPSLDCTNPAVLDFLKREFTTLGDWGFDYYKFDGEIAITKYAPAVDRDRLYDKSIDPLAAYRNRLAVIRQTIGPKGFIEGCAAGAPLDGIGYFNSYFNGRDLCSNWQGMYPLFSSITANGFLNHLVTYEMAGEGIEVGPWMNVAEAEKKRAPSVLNTIRSREKPLTGVGVTLPEARTLVSYLGLTGAAYSVASVMPELPADRTRLLQMTLPTMPIFPMDLFSRGTDVEWDTFKHTTPDDYIHNYPRILDLKVNAKSGVYDVVGLTNWRSHTATQGLSFEDQLGLAPGFAYVAFDFWNQKLYGVFKREMQVEVEGHDTRVFLIHPLLNRPQLVGTSRHITGAYSIQSLAWDAPRNTLRGSSQTVPGTEYALWIYVPAGTNVSRVRATGAEGREITVRNEVSGNLLKIGFEGIQQPVNWEIKFQTGGASGKTGSSPNGQASK